MLVHEKTRSLVLRVNDPFAVRELIPHSRILAHPDYNLAVEHTEDAADILRNMGLDAPSPVLHYYNWPGKFTPFSHQREMVEFWIRNKRGFNLSDAGTGKTNGALWAADYLMSTGRVRKALLCVPLSTVDRVWSQDIFDTLMHRRSVVVHGTYDKRLSMLAADVDFYILNHDGVKVGEIAKIVHAREDIDLVLVDEGDFFSEARTEKYRALRKLLRPDMRLWWQTATPAANKPTQAWAQARLVNPSRVPEHFGTFQRMTMVQLSQHKWVPRPNSEEIIHNALQPAIRFRKADCLDLPPVVTTERQCELSPEQRKAFETMRREMKVEHDSGSQITAVNAADKIGKLRQILCGAVLKPGTDEYVVLDHAPRLNELIRAADTAVAKVIVIVPFKGITQALEKELSKRYTVAVLNGDVTIRQRDQIVRDFKGGPDPHMLLCHPRVMSHGLNLVEADMTIFYAPIYSNTEYRQVIERNNRAGQVNKMTVVRLAAHPIEWEIYKMVDERQVTQENVLNLYTSIIGRKPLDAEEEKE